MSNKNDFRMESEAGELGGKPLTKWQIFTIPVLMIVVLWLVKGAEYYFNLNLIPFGVFPRSPDGIMGIFFSAFIHSDLGHLTNNMFPLFFLSCALYYFYHNIANRVVIWIWLLSGFWLWLAARPSYHIGASNVVYGLASFVFFAGMISRNFKLVAASLLVVFWYGSMIWGIFPIDYKVSWEGHLYGAVAGGMTAFGYRHYLPKRKTFEWEEEEDEDEEEDDEDAYWKQDITETNAPRIRYWYRKKN